jgi:hypothetical protein
MAGHPCTYRRVPIEVQRVAQCETHSVAQRVAPARMLPVHDSGHAIRGTKHIPTPEVTVNHSAAVYPQRPPASLDPLGHLGRQRVPGPATTDPVGQLEYAVGGAPGWPSRTGLIRSHERGQLPQPGRRNGEVGPDECG